MNHFFPTSKIFESDGAFQIFNDGYVTTDNGTGVVHLAPSFGEDDNRVMKEAGLNLELCPINDKGEFLSLVTDFAVPICKRSRQRHHQAT